MQVGLTYDADAGQPGCSAALGDMAAALEKLGHQAIQIGSAMHLVDKLAAGQRFDLVLCCNQPTSSPHNPAVVPMLLDTYAIPYAFSMPATLEICNLPSAMKSLLRDRGIPTSDYWLVETLGDIPRVDGQFPLNVGPTMRCCESLKVTANDVSELSKACCQLMGQYGTPAMVEPKLAGQMIEVGLLGSGASAMVLMPSQLNTAWSNSLQRTAQAAWRVVGGLDAGSITMQCDGDGQPHVMNIEPIPSLTIESQFTRLACSSGLTFEEVLQRIIDSACQRSGQATHRPTLHTHMSRTKAMNTAQH